MTERAIFLFRSAAASDSFFNMASAWPLSCTKLTYCGSSCLLNSARTAGTFVVDEIGKIMPYGVSAELYKPADLQFMTAVRMSVGDDLLAAFWFGKKLEKKINAFLLAGDRLDQINRALKTVEQVSLRHFMAAHKTFPRIDELGVLPMGVYFKVVEMEYFSLFEIVHTEVADALL